MFFSIKNREMQIYLIFYLRNTRNNEKSSHIREMKLSNLPDLAPGSTNFNQNFSSREKNEKHDQGD